ncbi:hypothetical protein P3T42_002550 [Paraburkholderia sp. GAS38]
MGRFAPTIRCETSHSRQFSCCQRPSVKRRRSAPEMGLEMTRQSFRDQGFTNRAAISHTLHANRMMTLVSKRRDKFNRQIAVKCWVLRVKRKRDTKWAFRVCADPDLRNGGLRVIVNGAIHPIDRQIRFDFGYGEPKQFAKLVMQRRESTLSVQDMQFASHSIVFSLSVELRDILAIAKYLWRVSAMGKAEGPLWVEYGCSASDRVRPGGDIRRHRLHRQQSTCGTGWSQSQRTESGSSIAGRRPTTALREDAATRASSAQFFRRTHPL